MCRTDQASPQSATSVVLVFLLQPFIIIFHRLLHTAIINNLIERDNAKNPSFGWVLPSCCCQFCDTEVNVADLPQGPRRLRRDKTISPPEMEPFIPQDQ